MLWLWDTLELIEKKIIFEHFWSMKAVATKRDRPNIQLIAWTNINYYIMDLFKTSNEASFFLKNVQRGKRKQFGKDKWPTKFFLRTRPTQCWPNQCRNAHTVFPLTNAQCDNFSTTPWRRMRALESCKIV